MRPLTFSSISGEQRLVKPGSLTHSEYSALVQRLAEEDRGRARWHEQNTPKLAAFLDELQHVAHARRIHSETYGWHGDYQKCMGEILGVGTTKSTLAIEFIEAVDVPAKILHATESNRPITKKPPFDCWWWEGRTYRRGGADPIISNHLEAATGLVGQSSICVTFDAGVEDFFKIDWENRLGFFRDIPVAGRWDIWINAICRAAHSSYTLRDEAVDPNVVNAMSAGITFTADTFPSANLCSPNPFGIGELWHTSVDGLPREKQTASNIWRKPGQEYWFHYTTPFIVPAKKGTLIRVGTHDAIDALLNETTAIVLMDNRWQITQVTIDIVE